MAWEITDIKIGDEVGGNRHRLKAAGWRTGQSASRPTASLIRSPYSIPAPKKAKPGDELQLTGEVTRVDEDNRKVTVKAGGLITVDADTITGWTPVQRKKTALRDEAD